MGLALLRAFLAASGDGDVGPTLTIPGESPDEPPQVLPRLDEPRSRPYLSIFGEVTIERVGYGHDRLDAAPLDARLHLPRRQYSHLLQKWLGAFVIDDAHAEAVRKLQMILGLSIPVKASEDLNREQASDVEPFQDQPAGARALAGGVDSWWSRADCKGVPLIRSALAAAESEEDAQETATSSAAAPSPGQGREGEQEADGGGGGGVHHRAVRPHHRRGDRRVAAEESREASSPSAAQASASGPAAGQGHAVPLAGR